MTPKDIAVFGPDNRYLSHCTQKRAKNLLSSQKAIKIDHSTIKLLYTKQAWKEVKKNIIKDSGRICYICGRYIDDTATIDHVTPSSRSNYANIYSNLQCCCLECNHDKGSRKISEYVDHIEKHRFKYLHISDEQIKKLKSFALFHDYEFNSNRKNHIHVKKSRSKKYKGEVK